MKTRWKTLIVVAAVTAAAVWGCATGAKEAFQERIGQISDAGLKQLYLDTNAELRAIDRSIRRDRSRNYANHGLDPSGFGAEAFASSGYTDLLARQKMILEEMRRRRLRP